MKKELLAHPEAMVNSIVDVMRDVEDCGVCCEIIVISALAIADLMKEGRKKGVDVKLVSSGKVFVSGGFLATMWRIFLYPRKGCDYTVQAYGKDYSEFKEDYPNMYSCFKEMVELNINF